jgi:phage terminase Nu1 subunit (DNA packaging protein)
MDTTQLLAESNEVFETIEVNLSKAAQHMLNENNSIEKVKTEIETYKLSVLMNIASTLKEINEHLEIISKKN